MNTTKINISNFYTLYKKTSIYKNIHNIHNLTADLKKNLNLSYFAMIKYDQNNIMSCFTSCGEILSRYAKRPEAFYEDPCSSPARVLKQGVYHFTQPCSICTDIYTKTCKGFSFITDYENGEREIFNYFINKPDFNHDNYCRLQLFSSEFKDKATNLLKKSDKIFVPIISPGTNPISMLNNLFLLGNDTLSFFTENEYNHCKSLQLATTYNLSHRETQCLSLLLQGKLNKQISDSLGLSQRTVEVYISNMKHKLGCRNKNDVVIKTLSSDFKALLLDTVLKNMEKTILFNETQQASSVRYNYNKSRCLSAAQKYNLSPREIQCLMHILEGKINKQIAYLLNLQQRTVESYVDNIKNKLGCHTKTELVIKVLF